ncbi:PAS domain-containing sensor histidine kinase [Methylophilus sp. Leaf459]|nr:PAS domain-containing sensor histidine kinase [Methylophilus sp. Leaf416]KQT56876.1 PAS domain-containing sensor histidine kinase [Methylophilus sp. Leaf459]
MLNPDGQIVSWNTGAERFKGYKANEVIGKHFSMFMSREDRDAGLANNILDQAAANGRFEAEGWRIRKDGSGFWANIVVDAIYNNTHELIGFAKITRDISERKAAHESLLESERRFRYLVEGVTDYAIYMLSPEGIVTNWNSGAQRIKGYLADEVIGTHFSRFMREEDRADGMPERSLRIAREDGRFENEGWRVRKDGSLFLAHIIIDAIHNNAGELIGFAKITRDITEKKIAEENLAKVNAALFQAQKMDAIGNLTGGVAHDFNNLLSIISNGLDILAHSNPNPKQHKLLETMKRAVSRGSKLTQQLLSFARQQPLKPEPHDVNQLISTFELMLRRAVGSNTHINLDVNGTPLPILVDSTSFEASLLNLVVNAKDSMPDGGQIRIISRKRVVAKNEIEDLPEGLYVEVNVTDTGNGIPKENIQQVLEPFFTTKEVGKGSGLGLSQVFGFVKQSEGGLHIKSEMNIGTSVSMLFPAVEDETILTGAVEESGDTVLVVEDDPDVLWATSQIFSMLGYEVYEASSGEAALEILRSGKKVSLVFTDVLMPGGINGIQLGRTLRDLNPHIQIVLASGYPLPALKKEHGDLDEFQFLNKPYDLVDIERVISSTTSGNHPAA